MSCRPAFFRRARLLHLTVALALAIIVTCAVVGNASALPLHAVRAHGDAGTPYGLSADCTITGFNWCSGWLWEFTEVPGAVWGSVMSAAECPGGCLNGGVLTQIALYAHCNAGAPGRLGDLAINAVDAAHCRTATLMDLGPQTLTHCVSGDHWTVFNIPGGLKTSGNWFAVTITWGRDTTNPQPVTTNGLANFVCSRGISGTFPGCYYGSDDCNGYSLALDPQRSFIYVTDWYGDGILRDICALYGQPASLSYPYMYGYSYVTNNIPIVVGLQCTSPTAVEGTSWGHVKALFE